MWTIAPPRSVPTRGPSSCSPRPRSPCSRPEPPKRPSQEWSALPTSELREPGYSGRDPRIGRSLSEYPRCRLIVGSGGYVDPPKERLATRLESPRKLSCYILADTAPDDFVQGVGAVLDLLPKCVTLVGDLVAVCQAPPAEGVPTVS